MSVFFVLAHQFVGSALLLGMILRQVEPLQFKFFVKILVPDILC